MDRRPRHATRALPLAPTALGGANLRGMYTPVKTRAPIWTNDRARVPRARTAGRTTTVRQVRPVLDHADRSGDADACVAERTSSARAPATRSSPKRRNPRRARASRGTATGIRTRVSAVRGRRPSPLDDSGAGRGFIAAGGAVRRLVNRARRDVVGPGSCAMVLVPVSPRGSRVPRADVAELVDAHGSGPCGGNSVEVRVLSSALVRRPRHQRGLLRSRGRKFVVAPTMPPRPPRAMLAIRRCQDVADDSRAGRPGR